MFKYRNATSRWAAFQVPQRVVHSRAVKFSLYHGNTDISTTIAVIQAYYDAIYNDPDVFRLFHKDINKCETATVTPWEDGKRTVTFGLALTIPAVVKKVVGEQHLQARLAARH